MTKRIDPIATALDEANIVTSRAGMIEHYFGERRDVLKSILAADKRGIPKTVIARILQAKLREEGNTTATISDGQVKSWLDRNRT